MNLGKTKSFTRRYGIGPIRSTACQLLCEPPGGSLPERIPKVVRLVEDLDSDVGRSRLQGIRDVRGLSLKLSTTAQRSRCFLANGNGKSLQFLPGWGRSEYTLSEHKEVRVVNFLGDNVEHLLLTTSSRKGLRNSRGHRPVACVTHRLDGRRHERTRLPVQARSGPVTLRQTPDSCGAKFSLI